MAIYSINTIPRQDVILGKLLIKINQNRAANSLPALTLAQLAQRLFSDSMDGYTKQDDDEAGAVVSAAYATATPGVQANIKAQLGI